MALVEGQAGSKVELKNLQQLHLGQQYDANASRETTATSQSQFNEDVDLNAKPILKDEPAASEEPVRTVHGFKVSATNWGFDEYERSIIWKQISICFDLEACALILIT